jgi:hypothetical protein
MTTISLVIDSRQREIFESSEINWVLDMGSETPDMVCFSYCIALL